MPVTIPPEQAALLRRIHELEFSAIDLNLFLDTHPDDQAALCDYNAVTGQAQALREEYEHRYGPLTVAGFGLSRCPWAWIEDPWPWEICY
ncbi:MAG: spore coat protein CotJB [Firmicutes bacterium]|jgi:spore coat protein JB|nr:spore coat protein CotJB [Bacillota bacterium]